MSVQMKTKRIGPGEYERSFGGRVVRVFQHASGKWMAAAEWDPCLYTDLLMTKRDAIFNANDMLTREFWRKGAVV